MQVSIGVYTALQIAILVLTTKFEVQTHVSIISAALSVSTGLALAALSHFEHVRSIRPSFLINVYLITTVLLDAARLRTQWLLETGGIFPGVLTASLVVKCIILFLEDVDKRSILLGRHRHFPLESTCGLASRGSFWWLNPLLLTGFHNILSLDELPLVHDKLDSAYLDDTMQNIWRKRMMYHF